MDSMGGLVGIGKVWWDWGEQVGSAEGLRRGGALSLQFLAPGSTLSPDEQPL